MAFGGCLNCTCRLDWRLWNLNTICSSFWRLTSPSTCAPSTHSRARSIHISRPTCKIDHGGSSLQHHPGTHRPWQMSVADEPLAFSTLLSGTPLSHLTIRSNNSIARYVNVSLKCCTVSCRGRQASPTPENVQLAFQLPLNALLDFISFSPISQSYSTSKDLGLSASYRRLPPFQAMKKQSSSCSWSYTESCTAFEREGRHVVNVWSRYHCVISACSSARCISSTTDSYWTMSKKKRG